MTKIDIFSGFLGAGKTTLIQKMLCEGYSGEKLMLIENEFGEIGIDSGFMKDAGIEITEMNSGCICCSLVGDFTEALVKVLEDYKPDRILIEPSGVGKLSDVIKAVQEVESESVKLNAFTTVVDALKCKVYAKNFGEFYEDQVRYAKCLVLSRTQGMSSEKLNEVMAHLRGMNEDAVIVTTPWDSLAGADILAAMENTRSLKNEMERLAEEACPVCGHHHNDHSYSHSSDHCHHDHHQHTDENHKKQGACSDCEGEHHHHHHHYHDHEHTCDDKHCHHHNHSHHHADDVFDSWGVECTNPYSAEDIESALSQLNDEQRYGLVLRAKGIVCGVNGEWIHFDYVPGCTDVRAGAADVIGRICVIGSSIDKNALADLFRVKKEAP